MNEWSFSKNSHTWEKKTPPLPYWHLTNTYKSVYSHLCMAGESGRGNTRGQLCVAHLKTLWRCEVTQNQRHDLIFGVINLNQTNGQWKDGLCTAGILTNTDMSTGIPKKVLTELSKQYHRRNYKFQCVVSVFWRKSIEFTINNKRPFLFLYNYAKLVPFMKSFW